MRPESHVLAGWGEAQRAVCRSWPATSTDDVVALLRRFHEEQRPIALRGAGRSYGDAATLDGGDVLDLRRLRAVRAFDRESGHITVEAGVTIEDLWRTTLPAGWWPPVVPGTMHPTLGGCIAMNVHGKNHFAVGCIGEHVEELEVVLPGGEIRTLTPADELFRAVVGGFGMLGVVTAIRLRLKRVESGLLDVTALATASLADMHRELEARVPDSDYAVGWIDAFHGSARGVLHTASYRSGDDAAAARASLALDGQDLPARIMKVMPRDKVAPLLRRATRFPGLRGINTAKYLATRIRGEHRFTQSLVAFSFLLDYVPRWKSIYDPHGLVQQQSFVPKERALEVQQRILATCREHRIIPWLAVLKRHRPDDFLMSHSVDGFSLALDFPVTDDKRGRLWWLCQELDRIAIEAGGNIYLAKDLTAEPKTLAAAYPGLERFREWKRELDPHGILVTDQAKRLAVSVSRS